MECGGKARSAATPLWIWIEQPVIHRLHRWTQIPIGRRQLRKPATRAGVGAKGAKMGKRSERRNSQLRTCHAAGVVSRIVRMGDGRANPPGEPGSDSPTAETTKYTNDTARQSRNQKNWNPREQPSRKTGNAGKQDRLRAIPEMN